MKSVEFEGNWWIPGRENEAVFGKLSYLPESSIKLRLQGSLGRMDEEYPIILGRAIDGKPITLINSYVRLESLVFHHTHGTWHEFTVDEVLLGHGFDNYDEIRFKSIEVKYNGLMEWSSFSGVGYDLERDNRNRPRKLTYVYNFEDPLISRNTSRTIKLIPSVSQNMSRTETKIVINARYKIDFRQERHFRKIHETFIYPLQNLLTLIYQKPIFILEIKFFSPRIATLLSSESRYQEPIEYLSLQRISKKDIEFQPNRSDMIFSLRDYSDTFDNLIKKWFEVCRKCKEAVNVYISAFYCKIDIEVKFLDYSRALEAYHRVIFGSTVRIRGHKRKIIFEKRVEGVLDIIKGVFAIRNRRYFIKRIVNSRNYYTHRFERLKIKPMQGFNLYLHTEILNMIMQILLLKEIGFTDDQIIGLYDKNRQMRFIEEKTKWRLKR